MLNQNLLLTGDDGYNLTKSLRFRSSASAYLNRTFGTPTSSQKFTWSGWIKRGKLDSSGLQGIFAPYSSGTVYGYIAWYQDGIRVYDRLSGGTNYLFQTTAVYRDPSAWYHIVVAVDTTQATAANRVRLYVNGVEVTAFSSSTYPTQNNSTTTNSAIAHNIGYDPSNTAYLDGYQGEINFVDGQQLTPSSFGQTSTTTGVWIPKKYTGTYGTNGFYLPFTNTASTATLGNDFSGNSNTWTVNNISLTAGSTYDSMNDVPTLTSATVANYAVASPIDKNSNISVTNANLTVADSSGTNSSIRSTIGVSSGKWYWEWTVASVTTFVGGGIATANTSLASYIGDTADSYGYLSHTGNKYNNGTAYSYGATFTTNDVIGVALDLDAGTLTYYKNNTSQGTAFTGLTGTFIPAFSCRSGSLNINFGQRPFSYTPPTGFLALNTFNLPTPTIGATASTQANKYMDATTYTGNGGTQAIVNAGAFKPDFVWMKKRSSAESHILQNSIAGTTKFLISNSTATEDTSSAIIQSFDTNGFTVGSSSVVNGSATTYVGWQWQAGQGTTSSNTSGSITSTVSASTTAGFSIVTYTGNSTVGATIGHGLGVAPQLIIIKSRSNAYNWVVGSKAIDGFSTGKQLYLNTTSSVASGETFFANTQPTSSVFSVKDNYEVNFSGYTYVAYCFAQVAGYSAFGSYTGNGSSDGTMVFTGFKPKFVMIKRTDSTGGWMMSDTVRSTFNVIDDAIEAQSSSAEFTNDSFYRFDALSNGFKLRGTSSAINSSGGTYIYMAFAENPFKFSNAR